jgi:hypothetical protein
LYLLRYLGNNSQLGKGFPKAWLRIFQRAPALGGDGAGATYSGVPEDHATIIVTMARAILDRHTSIDPVRRGAKYRESGSNQFDPAAADYVAVRHRSGVNSPRNLTLPERIRHLGTSMGPGCRAGETSPFLWNAFWGGNLRAVKVLGL